ncbi:MAG TPA: hypothetical protein VEH84_09405 [Alphaproteobacteria bacterium]|nr:hypothetical protein [Alphaproteobacteria bacterium]
MDIADDTVYEAARILAAALDEPPLRGNLALRPVNRALRQALALRLQGQLDFAAEAFDQLDPAMRRQIADRATAEAQRVAVARRNPRPAPPARQATGLLQALNARRVEP